MESIIAADDKTIIRLIEAAQHRLIVLAPALSKPVADAISERWAALGPK